MELQVVIKRQMGTASRRSPLQRIAWREESRREPVWADAGPDGIQEVEREFNRSEVTSASASQFYLAAKRALDIFGAFFGLLFLAPVFAVVAVLVRMDSRGPVFHRRRVLARQEYEGDAEELADTFDAFKFRTMVSNADDLLRTNPTLWQEYQKDFKLREDPRVTPLGSTLRRLSLDELPQLVNILRGEMSLVGPRMISPPELAMYGGEAGKLLSVKPGLTGLWQVSGRTNVSYQERVRLDMWYIENRSLRLDLEILWRTVGCVLSRRGAV